MPMYVQQPSCSCSNAKAKIVEARQVGEASDMDVLAQWVTGDSPDGDGYAAVVDGMLRVNIRNNVFVAGVGDWVIKDANGKFTKNSDTAFRRFHTLQP